MTTDRNEPALALSTPAGMTALYDQIDRATVQIADLQRELSQERAGNAILRDALEGMLSAHGWAPGCNPPIPAECEECAARAALSMEAGRDFLAMVRGLVAVLVQRRDELAEDVAGTPRGCDSRPPMERDLAEMNAALEAAAKLGVTP